MTHLEGPIVQSLYDMALLSWFNAMHPPLPLLTQNPTYGNSDKSAYSFGQDHPVMSSKGDLDSKASRARETLAQHHAQTEEPNNGQTMAKKQDIYDSTNQDEAERVDDQFRTEESITQHLSEPILILVSRMRA